MQRAAKEIRKQGQMGIERPLEPPKNGLLVPDLVPVAYEVLDQWKELVRGLKQLLNFVPIYGCRYCSEVHVGLVGHQIPDCLGSGNGQRRSLHSWVRGSINDVLLPIESYHVFDPFGRRIKHEHRFDYDRIPAIVELCIQAGVDIPEYPSRRRTQPIRMMGKKVIDHGGHVEDPQPYRSREEDSMALLSELDTFGPPTADCPPETDRQRLAERTLKAYSSVRRGLRLLMRKYTVKCCGYCSEVHVGPFGHDVKLCGAFKHQWRDGPAPNYVWHVRDPVGPPLTAALKRFYGKAPAVVEMCVQAAPPSRRPTAQ
ncbi:unnamed protein product [Spirodela intermedia]|uniref:APO domain-containing protein n=1 Tax=Spirodela intermedia TaxID=51605 RepID=A0A7I8JMR9_SPIIN|nr:unnamed protein product [Spirodela intermedia]CAA6670762.1 unnamed protein product [Spirodela intermedia]